ncbi:MAG: RNA-binding protein [Gammaproteobacteria bacterium]|nr:RNA-binding protein [Gammaproteobacteria bacterium]
MSGPLRQVRVDKWLWAARFFKTRALATAAVGGGKVHVNGERVKPSRAIREGDELRIRRGPVELVVVVRGVADRRGPAPEARRLYEETVESVRARERLRTKRRLRSAFAPHPGHRPDKRQRRRIRRFTGKD